MKLNTNLVYISLLLFICALGCTKNNSNTISNKQNSSVSMNASFTQLTKEIDIRLQITGLEPNSSHGLHIHEVGECIQPGFASAGPHFNPDSHDHGAPEDNRSHFGDLGNITANNNGTYTGVIKIKNDSTESHSILNRSLVLHQKGDDLKTQPSGNSGDRIACVVIRSIM